MNQFHQSIIVVDAAVVNHKDTLIVGKWIHLWQLCKGEKNVLLHGNQMDLPLALL